MKVVFGLCERLWCTPWSCPFFDSLRNGEQRGVRRCSVSTAHLSEQYNTEMLGETICFSHTGLVFISCGPAIELSEGLGIYQNCKKLAAMTSHSSSSVFGVAALLLLAGWLHLW